HSSHRLGTGARFRGFFEGHTVQCRPHQAANSGPRLNSRSVRVKPFVSLVRLVLVLGAVLPLAACERRSGQTVDSGTGEILVGFYGSLTGDGASFGQSSREGTELGLEEV